jgi:hypothetical protein
MTAAETSSADEDGGRAALWRFRRKKASVIALADRARDAAQWELAGAALDRNPRNPPIWVQFGHALMESGNLCGRGSGLPNRNRLRPEGGRFAPAAWPRLKNPGEKERADTGALVLEPESPFAPEELRGLGWSAAEMHELYRMLDGAERPPNAAALRPGPSKPVENAESAV